MTDTNKAGIFTVALNKLERDPKNVRKTYREEGIQELWRPIGAAMAIS
ncbi:hypothetical protein [Brucella intermedia]|nr:hypothetical protein [Brucella intermedia]